MTPATPNRRLTRHCSQGRHVELRLDPAVAVKPVGDHRIVGRSPPRVDIPAKVAGGLVFVHDQRLPGMLHGRVVRPPYAGADHGDFIGNTLESVDESSIAHIPGVRARRRDPRFRRRRRRARGTRRTRSGRAEACTGGRGRVCRRSTTWRRRCATTRRSRAGSSTTAMSTPRSRGAAQSIDARLCLALPDARGDRAVVRGRDLARRRRVRRH